MIYKLVLPDGTVAMEPDEMPLQPLPGATVFGKYRVRSEPPDFTKIQWGVPRDGVGQTPPMRWMAVIKVDLVRTPEAASPEPIRLSPSNGAEVRGNIINSSAQAVDVDTITVPKDLGRPEPRVTVEAIEVTPRPPKRKKR